MLWNHNFFENTHEIVFEDMTSYPMLKTIFLFGFDSGLYSDIALIHHSNFKA